MLFHLQVTKGSLHHCAKLSSLDSWLSTDYWDGCFGLCPHGHPFHSISNRQWSPPNCFSLLDLYLPKLNYNVHNKELLAIFEAFKIWWHYLKGSLTLIDMVTNHKNLEYFSITKLLTCHQVRWSEFLCQFNLIIWFCPRCLGTKPNALTRWWDVYPKEGESNYASINPTNL